MASPVLNLRACSLLRQLQWQHRQSYRLLILHRYSSSSSSIPPTTKQEALGSSPSTPKATEPPSKPPEDDIFVPEPLDRPLGLSYPPKPGQNTGIDHRTVRQRRDDFVNYDKHLERRKVMTAQMARPYYRDWKNMRHQEGKLWIAPERLFRADKALYFPNLQGATLETPHDARDTTDVLQDKVSVVKLFSGNWAMTQAETFTKGNEELGQMMDDGIAGRSPLQNVQINLEQNAVKSWLIRIFVGSIKKQLPDAEHERYFMITKGLSGQLKEYIGMFNSSVGFVYLVDQDCRIRWAGSANALPEEKASLARGAARLVKEYRRAVGEKHWSESGFDPELYAK